MKKNKLVLGIILAILSIFILYVMVIGIVTSKSSTGHKGSIFNPKSWVKVFSKGDVEKQDEEYDSAISTESTSSMYFAAYDVSEIDVSMASEDIVIQEGGVISITVTFKGNWNGSNPSAAVVNGTLSVKKAKNVNYKGSRIVEIMIPSGWEGSYNLNTASGDVNANISKANAVKFSTASGNIYTTVTNAKNMTCKTISGDLRIKNASANMVTICSVSGDIQCSFNNVNNITGSTTSGDLSLEGNILGFNLSSVSGDIKIDSTKVLEHNSRIDTTSGDIIFTDKTGTAYNYKAKTKSGSLKSNINFNLSPRNGTTISFNTVSGDINLR